jgi:hypothetical protein
MIETNAIEVMQLVLLCITLGLVLADIIKNK